MKNFVISKYTKKNDKFAKIFFLLFDNLRGENWNLKSNMGAKCPGSLVLDTNINEW